MGPTPPTPPSAGPRVRRDALANRQAILRVAKQLFAEQGAVATSMHEIARTAGVGQGTLYRHFADKEELCTALLREDIALFQEVVGARIHDTAEIPSPLARLALLISEKIRMTESHLPLFAAIDHAKTPGKHRPFRGPFYLWMHAEVIALLTSAQQQAEVEQLDIEVTADALLASCAPHLYDYQRNQLGYSSERILATLLRLFVDGIRAHAAQP